MKLRGLMWNQISTPDFAYQNDQRNKIYTLDDFGDEAPTLIGATHAIIALIQNKNISSIDFCNSANDEITSNLILVAEHKDDCLTKCGREGKCSYCNLSNSSPGFCCHPDGRGSGCTSNMINAVRAASLGENYQCVVPKEFDAVTTSQLKILPQQYCWQKCGRKPGFAGQCDYCGPQGYCCNADGREHCPGTMSTFLAIKGIRGYRCVVPATKMDDHRLETTERSRCKSLKAGALQNSNVD